MRQEQSAQLEPGNLAFVRKFLQWLPEIFKHLNVLNGYLKAPEKLLSDIVVAD